MAKVTFELVDTAFEILEQQAFHEERTTDGQAKILVLKALNVYKEFKPGSPTPKRDVKPSVKAPVSVAMNGSPSVSVP